MTKDEFITKYGEDVYNNRQVQSRAWQKAHPEAANLASKKWNKKHPEVCRRASKKWSDAHPEEAHAAVEKWRVEHPEVVRASNQERGRKGGKHYMKTLEYYRTGIPGERKRIRTKHQIHYRPYKKMIAPNSQLHHQWVPGTSNYTGLALVEADQHMHGIINVIEILEGKITLLTEEEIRNA
jgi:hypothetical protein